MSEKTAKGADLARGERLQIMLRGDELGVIDDFRFANRMPSRAAAVRELLRRGIAAAGYTIDHSANAQDFGVIESGSVTHKDKP